MKLNRRKILQNWWLLPVTAAFGFFAWLGLRTISIKFGKKDPGTPKFKSGQKFFITEIDKLPKIWDFYQFEYPIQIGNETKTISSILIKTKNPQIGGITVDKNHFIALSRICTHIYCVSNYVQDPETASITYNYRPDQPGPILGCACHFSVFSPEQAGKSVSGPAIAPLPRIQLKIEGKKIYAVGFEESN